MINLVKLAEYLENVLNAPSTTVDDTNFANPTTFQYKVETTGFHIDHIFDIETGQNFIPVFIAPLGGQNNPVPDLKQSEITVPITIYFPVRFKDSIFELYDYLCDVFVGRFHTFGTKKARCNISIPQFGEIQDIDFSEFNTWVGSVFRETIERMEPYISMTVSLYLSTAGADFIYGDHIKITKITIYNGTTKILEDTNPICIERVDVASSESTAQQSFTDYYAKGYPANLGYSKQLPLMVKNNTQYSDLIKACEDTKNIQNLKIEISESFAFTTALITTHSYYVTNYSRRTAYGSLFAINLSLADLRS